MPQNEDKSVANFCNVFKHFLSSLKTRACILGCGGHVMWAKGIVQDVCTV